MLRPNFVSLLTTVCLIFILGCDAEEPISYCSAEVSCPGGQACDLATNTCQAVGGDGGVADGLSPDHATAPDQALSPDKALAPDLAPVPDQAPAPDQGVANGAKCGAASECKSGFCVDKRCCDAKCAGVCRGCVLTGKEGTCALVSKGQDPDNDCAGKHKKCGGACDGQGACFFAPASTTCEAATCKAGKLTTSNCDGKGGCAGTTTGCGGYACASTGDACKLACTSVADCGANFQCIGGACVSNLVNGKACGTNNKACASGNCVDGVCCSSTSCQPCNKCNISGKQGTCAAVKDLTICGAAKCAGGASTKKVCKAGTCASLSKSCGDFACNLTADACLEACSNNKDCASAAYCGGALCLPRAAKGTKCTSGNTCLSGNCVDGVCCGTSTCGSCNKCNLPGKQGTCSPVADKTVCGKPFCVTSSFAQDVATAMTCKAGACTPGSKSCGHYLCNTAKTACAKSCKTSKDCYNSAYCESGYCKEKKQNGNKCTGNDQCKGYFCVDGYCCDGACTDDCGSCKIAGRQGKCSPKPKNTVCGKDHCSQGHATAYRCAGTNFKCEHKFSYCQPYKCDSAKKFCAKSCTGHSQCSTGYCDTSDFFGAKNSCAATTSTVCYVHTSSCGDGSKAKPACSIQKCLDAKARYVLVANGKYSENLTVKADVAILSTGTSGILVVNGLPQQNVAKVYLTPPANNKPGINIYGKFKVMLFGLDISHSSSSASGDLIYIAGADMVTIKTCVLHDGKGAYKAGVSALMTTQLSLQDVALYKFEGYGLFSYSNALVSLESVGVAFAASDNVKVAKGTLRMRDVLLATGGTAGLNASSAKLDLDRVRTQFNGGYGLYASDCTGHVSNLLAADNLGHGVYLETNSCPLLTNVTVANNAPTFPAYFDIYCHKSCGAKIHNSVIWSAAASGIKYSKYCQFSHSDVKTGRSQPVAGSNNINAKPLFVGNGAHPYALAGSSPCVDAGNDSVLSQFTKRTKDLQGLKRQVDKAPGASKLDMGAYEVQ